MTKYSGRGILLKLQRYIVYMLCLLGILSCDSLFYYPTQKQYRKVKEPFEDVYISSESENQLHGYYFHSQEKPPKALVLFFHGNARNISALYTSFLWLTKQGYDYMLFDYSGYGKSTGRAGRQALYHDGIAMLDYAYKYSKQKGYPLIVIGQSIGGAVLLGSLKDFPQSHELAIICIDSSFPSYRDIADYHTHNTVKVPIPLGSCIITDNHKPADSLPYLKNTPMLVSHCRQDKTVPLKFGKKLYRLAESRKWFWEFDCTHSAAYWDKENQRKLAEFFNSRIQEVTEN